MFVHAYVYAENRLTARETTENRLDFGEKFFCSSSYNYYKFSSGLGICQVCLKHCPLQTHLLSHRAPGGKHITLGSM